MSRLSRSSFATTTFLRRGERCLELGAALDGVGALAALNLNKLLGKLQAFSLSELDQGAALCRKAQTGPGGLSKRECR